MKISILLLGIVFLLGCDDVVFAGNKYNSNTGTKDYCMSLETEDQSVSNKKCNDIRVPDAALSKVLVRNKVDYFLLLTGVPIGGATSMTSSDTVVPLSYSYVDKIIAADPAFNSGTLADGVAGQTLTLVITANEGTESFTLIPSRKRGFTSIVFYGKDDRATLLYVDDTIGWIVFSESGVTVNLL